MRKDILVKTRTSILYLIAIAFLLSACNGTVTKLNPNGPDMQGTIFVEADGSGEVVIAVNATSAMQSSDTTNDDPCGEMEANMGEEDVTVDEEKHGSDVWCSMTRTFGDLDEFVDVLGSGADKSNISNDVFTFDYTTNTNYIPDSVIRVVMPGKVKKGHNADSVSGRTLTWNLKSESGEVNLFAQSDLSGGSSVNDIITSYWWVGLIVLCCCSLLVIVAGILIYVLWRKKASTGRR
jgi:hypothetical protein